MMFSNSKFVLLVSMLLTILVALQFKSGKSNIFFKDKITMYITNNSTNGLQLGVHCRDKNHDVGFRSLHVGETYTFTFRAGILFKNTLYYCNFSWSNSVEHHSLNVYDQSRDDNTVEKGCHWEISQSRPCRLTNPNSRECFQWP